MTLIYNMHNHYVISFAKGICPNLNAVICRNMDWESNDHLLSDNATVHSNIKHNSNHNQYNRYK